ncbi:MAG: hypothetical protein J7L75_01535, partial [Thermoproteales archaeon]|nr:hypothetical protein [Thermoproteales archaeon]
VALIVGYWIWTVVVGSIRTERLTLTIPSATYEDDFADQLADFGAPTATAPGWIIRFRMSNNGPSDSTIIDIRINGKSISLDDYAQAVDAFIGFDTDGDGTVDDIYTWNGGTARPTHGGANMNGIPVGAGNEAEVVLVLSEGIFRSGQTIEIAFVTAANQVYTSSIALP